MKRKYLEVFKKVIRLLEENDFDYVVVGGAALAIHTGTLENFDRVKDIDIIVLDTPSSLPEDPEEHSFVSLREILSDSGISDISFEGDAILISEEFAGKTIEIVHPIYFYLHGKHEHSKQKVKFLGTKFSVRPLKYLKEDCLAILRNKLGVKEAGKFKKADARKMLIAVSKLGIIESLHKKRSTSVFSPKAQK